LHLRRFARYLARDADLADDLVQDCLMRAIENLEKWRPGTNLRAWLFVIIRNLFLNKKRRQKLERTLFASSGSVPETATPSCQESNLALKETEEALCELSGNHREVLLLVAVEGLSYEEAAGITNVSVGTIKSRVSRARSALKAKIEKRKAVALERWRLRSHLPARSGRKNRTPGDRAARAI